MPRSTFAALLLLAATAAGCATLSPEERAAACRATDWRNFGYNDGLLGVPAEDRLKRFADCAQLGYPADTTAYQTGRAEGLAEYCTVENGYDVGYAGRRYRGVCPPGPAQDFLQGYEQGRKDRPVRVYTSFGIGVGYFGYSPYWGSHWGSHRHHHAYPPRRHKDGE